jgi:hypothetical protein
MYWNNNLSGRKERRLPIIVAVRLSRVPYLASDKEEKTYTDNISAHGARVISGCSWQLAEQAQVTTVREEFAICGEVVYCQKLDDDRFCVGLKFTESAITWPTLRRYNGTITDFIDQTDAQTTGSLLSELLRR